MTEHENPRSEGTAPGDQGHLGRAETDEAMRGGGTAASRRSDSATRLPWIVGLLALIALIVLIVVF